MKLVLSVDAILPPLSGIGRYALEIARGMQASPEVESVRFWNHGTWVRNVDSLLTPQPVNLIRASPLLRNRLSRAVYGRIAPRIARWRLQRMDSHIFHSPNFYLPPFAGRSVATFHDLSFYRHPEFHPRARVEFMHREIPKTLERADLIIADSEFGRREIVDYLGYPERKTRVVYLGVDPAFCPREAPDVASTMVQFGLAHGRYALYVGTIEPRKNIGNLLAAYGRLDHRLRDRYPLVLAGGPGWASDDIHAQIRDAVAEGWVKYLGYVPEPDLPILFSGARCFVFPSLYEGFGLPVLEAMASGIPVLASDRASLPEISIGAARLVDPADVVGMSTALREVLQDDAWRSAAVAAGMNLARGYTWNKTVKETIDVYRSLPGMKDSATEP